MGFYIVTPSARSWKKIVSCLWVKFFKIVKLYAYACFKFDPAGFWGSIIDTGTTQSSTLLTIKLHANGNGVVFMRKELGQRQDH